MTISRGIMTKTRDMIFDGQSLKRELEGVKQAAKTDMLTGLLNRRGLEMAMTRSMDRVATTSNPLSVVISDIDHFKRINDTYGHLIGGQYIEDTGKTPPGTY